MVQNVNGVLLIKQLIFKISLMTFCGLFDSRDIFSSLLYTCQKIPFHRTIKGPEWSLLLSRIKLLAPGSHCGFCFLSVTTLLCWYLVSTAQYT